MELFIHLEISPESAKKLGKNVEISRHLHSLLLQNEITELHVCFDTGQYSLLSVISASGKQINLSNL